MSTAWATVIVGALAMLGTLGGAYLANRRSSALIAYRLEQLEKKVDKHNNVIERTCALEQWRAVIEEKWKGAERRLGALEREKNG